MNANDVYREAKALKGKYRVVFRWEGDNHGADLNMLGKVVADVYDTRQLSGPFGSSYGKHVKTITHRQSIEHDTVVASDQAELIIYQTMERMFIEVNREAKREIASRYIRDTAEIFALQLTERFNRNAEA